MVVEVDALLKAFDISSLTLEVLNQLFVVLRMGGNGFVAQLVCALYREGGQVMHFAQQGSLVERSQKLV